ncbi:hypothetical protein D6D02_03415 [Aureobasidium pullulans]|nr:hypothetical protein D6D02_03415 [Aureobasidium pullulans]
MTTQDNFDIAMPTQDQRDIVRPSTELGTPSLSTVQVSRSPSLPSGSPFWDQMDLISPPSSPSPSRVPESTMDLDRYVQRGFSEDLALPPRQIEKPFRFMDLPAELRIMIYEYGMDKRNSYVPWECPKPPCFLHYHTWCEKKKHRLAQQWLGPPLVMVNKQLRHEILPIYYATNDFNWYWDPEHIWSEGGEFDLDSGARFLKGALNFLQKNNLQMKSITACGSRFYYPNLWSLKGLLVSVRILAPLRRSLIQTGKAHPALGRIDFDYGSEVGYQIFRFAGTLGSKALGNNFLLESELRSFLHRNKATRKFVREIERCEDEQRWEENGIRADRKEERLLENTVKGGERWNGVLRSRVSKNLE